MSIQIKRGMKKDLPQLKDGELAFCRDTKELYVGNNGNENVSLTKEIEDRLGVVDSQLAQMKNLFVENEFVIDEYTILENLNIYFIGGYFNVNNELVLKNCKLNCDGINFKGDGRLLGIIKNDVIPFENIDLPHINLVLEKERDKSIEEGLVYVDCIIGKDVNDGSPEKPFRTLQVALDKVKQLNVDGKIILRSGRYNINKTITYNGNRNIIIKPNFSEKVNIGNELVYVNKLGDSLTIDNDRKVYKHNEDEIIYNLYDLKGNKLNISSSKGKGFSHEIRNRADGLIEHDGDNPLLKCKSDIYSKLDLMGVNNIKNGVITQWRNYGVTFSKILDYNAETKQVKYWSVSSKDGNKKGDSIYKNTQGKDIPYIIQNLSIFADDENYYSTPSMLYLPNDDNNVYFYPKNLTKGFDITNSRNLMLKNITISYVMPYFIDLTDNQQRGSANHPRLIGYISGEGVNNIKIINCKFNNLSVMCGYFIGDNTLIDKCNISDLDSGGFVTYGANNKFTNNYCYNIGKVLLQRGAITMVGDACNVSNNTIKRFSQCGIRFGEDFNDEYYPMNFECYNNEVSYMCMDLDGKNEEDRYLVDGGAIYWWGRSKENTYRSANCYENVVYNVSGDGHNNGIYCDGTPSNSSVKRNLVFNVGSYALDLVNPNKDILDNCVVNDNIFVGSVRFQGKNGGTNSFNINNVIANTHKSYLKNMFENITFAHPSPKSTKQMFRKINVGVEKDCICINKTYLKTISPSTSSFVSKFIKDSIQIPYENILETDGFQRNMNLELEYKEKWSGNVNIYKDAIGVVHMEGKIIGEEGCQQLAFVIPEKFRPYNTQNVVLATGGSGIATCQINAKGECRMNIWYNSDLTIGYPRPITIYLDNVSYRTSYEDAYYIE